MGVVIGDSPVTQFSYIEYQALMLALAASMCIGFLVIEFTLNRFQVLPLFFPGMFSIRERNFYFFDFKVNDVLIGKYLQREAKMLIRMTLCVVLSYLWQYCVLSTDQVVGEQFPIEQCLAGKDCFASELHFLTLVNRQHQAVNCQDPVKADFPNRVVVSCIKFVKPVASTWLMHLAIAHSVTQLNLKCFELLTWLAGTSRKVRRAIFVLMCLSILLNVILFFSEVMAEFTSSWLSFVMSFSVPVFLFCVFRSARVLARLSREASHKMTCQVEQNWQAVLASFGTQDEDAEEPASPTGGRAFGSRSLGYIAHRARRAKDTLASLLPLGKDEGQQVQVEPASPSVTPTPPEASP